MSEDTRKINDGDIGVTLEWLNRVINNNTAMLAAKNHVEVFLHIRNSQASESKVLAELQDSIKKAREELNNLAKVRDDRLRQIATECESTKTKLLEEGKAEIASMKAERGHLNSELQSLRQTVTAMESRKIEVARKAEEEANKLTLDIARLRESKEAIRKAIADSSRVIDDSGE